MKLCLLTIATVVTTARAVGECVELDYFPNCTVTEYGEVDIGAFTNDSCLLSMDLQKWICSPTILGRQNHLQTHRNPNRNQKSTHHKPNWRTPWTWPLFARNRLRGTRHQTDQTPPDLDCINAYCLYCCPTPTSKYPWAQTTRLTSKLPPHIDLARSTSYLCRRGMQYLQPHWCCSALTEKKDKSNVCHS